VANVRNVSCSPTCVKDTAAVQLIIKHVRLADSSNDLLANFDHCREHKMRVAYLGKF